MKSRHGLYRRKSKVFSDVIKETDLKNMKKIKVLKGSFEKTNFQMNTLIQFFAGVQFGKLILNQPSKNFLESKVRRNGYFFRF